MLAGAGTNRDWLTGDSYRRAVCGWKMAGAQSRRIRLIFERERDLMCTHLLEEKKYEGTHY